MNYKKICEKQEEIIKILKQQSAYTGEYSLSELESEIKALNGEFTISGYGDYVGTTVPSTKLEVRKSELADNVGNNIKMDIGCATCEFKDLLMSDKPCLTCVGHYSEWKQISKEEMYPKSFVEWIGEVDVSYHSSRFNVWILREDFKNRMTTEQLFEYWKLNIKR